MVFVSHMSQIICGIVLLPLWEVGRDLFGETKFKDL